MYQEIRVGIINVCDEQIQLDNTIELMLLRFNLKEWYDLKTPYWDDDLKKEAIYGAQMRIIKLRTMPLTIETTHAEFM